MVRNTILAALLLVVCGVATAAEPKARGAYIGGAVGASTFDDGGALAGQFFDDQDTSFQVYGGYKFFKYFAVEARYVNLGSFSDGVDSLDITAFSVHAVGVIPFGTSGWELFGQLGLGQVNQEVAGFIDEDDSAGAAGIGVRWHINESFAVAAQIDAYAWENDTLGLPYDFSVGTSQLAFQLNF